MLSRQRALDFIEKELKVEQFQSKFSTNGGKLGLLNEIMRAFFATVPYNNFVVLSTSDSKRRIQSYESIISECLNLRGGSCHVLNTFLKILLNAVGFEASLRGAELHVKPNIPCHHFVNVITNLQKPGDIYLCDAGAFYPTFNAVRLSSLDQSGFTEPYQWSFVQCRFSVDNDKVTRFHRKGTLADLFLGGSTSADWRPFYFFSTNLVKEKDIREGLDKTYREKTNCTTESPIFATYPIGKSITIAGHVLRIFDENTKSMETRTLLSQKEAVEVVSHWAPHILKDHVFASFPNLPPE